ncbi:alpha/beta fold hydrolase [Pediococcus siamensis]|uniref:alpha/beta fold hydrolase n=1 Tax=Pediococcus siamensis TaxID=381829 RepID=UPI0039A17615
MKFVTTDRVQLDYTSEGSGQPVLFLTGFGGAKEIWQHQRRFLLDHHYRVILLDLRNQGHSQHVSWGLRISRLAADVHELCDFLKLKQLVLVGNSMGGSVIWSYLSLFGSQDVAQILVVDQSPKMLNEPDWPYGFKDLNWENVATRLKSPLGHATFKHIDDDTFQLVTKVHQSYPFDEALNYPLLLNHAVQDWRDVIGKLTIPMLLVLGQQSPYFDYHFGDRVKKMSRFVEVALVSQSGHIVMAEQSCQFNQLLLAFLENGDKNLASFA